MNIYHNHLLSDDLRYKIKDLYSYKESHQKVTMQKVNVDKEYSLRYY
jgi:hypothetical protein